MKYREEADNNSVYESIGEDFIEFEKEVEYISKKIYKKIYKEKGYIQP